MTASPTPLDGVVLLTPDLFEDSRGSFREHFNQNTFNQVIGSPWEFVQDNLSSSLKGVLRGLHFQKPQSQGKLVSCLQGDIFDVVVDITRSSPNYGRFMHITLSGKTPQCLWIPPGFAHGFMTLSDEALVLYKVTHFYAPEWERTLAWDDPTLNINWPKLEGYPEPILSGKDRQGMAFEELEAMF